MAHALQGQHYIDPVGDLKTFWVEVKNNSTGEVRWVSVLSDHVSNAVHNILVYMFRESNWRSCTALQASES